MEIEKNKMIGHLKEAIARKQKYEFAANELQLYLAKRGDAWLKDNNSDDAVKQLEKGNVTGDIEEMCNEENEMKSSWSLQEWFDEYKMPEPTAREIHILVKLPSEETVSTVASAESTPHTLRQDVVWYGVRGSFERLLGIELNNERTLPRSTLTNDIIHRLDDMHFLFIKSPQMTGKTSLAILVSRELENRSKDQNNTSIIFSFSALQISYKETFLDAFKRQCEFDWESAVSFSTQGYMVYFVVDETQILYKDKDSTSSPRRKSAVFWDLVKAVQTNAMPNVRILMFTTYGSSPQYTQIGIPVDFPADSVLGIEHLNFSPEEIEEYVNKWFVGVGCLQDTTKAFCDRLKWLTGGHVGLCATAINALNEVCLSHMRRGNMRPSAQEWIRILEGGSLRKDEDRVLFDVLISTRAVDVLKTLTSEELDKLERLAYGMGTVSDAGTIELCIRKGILVQIGDQVKFSSPIMWRFFVKIRVGHIEHALYEPQNASENGRTNYRSY